MSLHARVLISLLLFIACTQAGEPKTVRLLTIGNSFSANATRNLADLAKAGGHRLVHTSLVISGASLEVHAKKAQANVASPQAKAGLYSNGLGLKDNLLAEKWDYVTLQQASIKSHDIATYQPYAGWLADYIAKHAPQAKLLVHQTWPYRVDDPRFTKPSDKPGEPKTQEEMYRGLTAAYNQIASDLGARIIPVGDAFYLADTDPQWGFRPIKDFNTNKAQYPALPEQAHSLHMGLYWRKSPDGKTHKLIMDGHHANPAGEYLGGCVWYEVLFGESVVGNRFLPKGLDADFARFLQETAHQAVHARAPGKRDAAAVIRSMAGQVAFWDFQGEAGQARVGRVLALRYNSNDSRVYVKGQLGAFENCNPFSYRESLFDGGSEEAAFTVGAVHRDGT
ncbi:MAG: DUF4886 domain-containing protein [Verrucomicrobiales bacterium]|nr:DUF4886 domain-containing protein [Verrucomicrobiales bacterium]MCP5557585.1 DUF4886 domain-containing protein [Verrucomicrobiaceae bacterium]